MTAFSTWLEEHLYVPILVGFAILALVMGAIYCLCRRNRCVRVIRGEITSPDLFSYNNSNFITWEPSGPDVNQSRLLLYNVSGREGDIIVIVIRCRIQEISTRYCTPKIRFKGSYYVYKRLEHEAEMAQQQDRERVMQQDVIRDTAYMNCQYYLRSHPNYRLLEQLKDIGSRIDKYWFLVCDIRTNEEVMLSCMHFNSKMSVPFTKTTSKTIKDMFSLLKHPHIFPVVDFDFSVEQNVIFVFRPVSQRGSLKDLIYQCRYTEPWYNKYSQRRKGLPVDSIKKYGKQVLSGLLYLEEKGFPPHGNIHSGNIMFVDDICRISGYENRFLAHSSRVYTLVKKKLKDQNKNALDTLCIGHLLYEMAFGSELTSAHPEPQHLIGHQSPNIVEILNFIFENESETYPTVQEISDHSFFRNVQLPELVKYNPAKIHFNEPMKTLLKTVKKGKPVKPAKPTSTKKKRTTGQSEPQTPTSLTTPVSPTTASTPRTPATPSTPKTPTTPAAPSSTVNLLPPPPPPPPPPAAPVSSKAAPPERQALLGDIRKGMKLKRSVTNDRSAPKV